MQEVLEKTELRSRIIKLAYPSVLEMMLHTMVGVMDVAFVGRLGAEELTAVAIADQVVFTIVFVLGTIGIGASVIVARAIGKKDPEEAGSISRHALVLGVLLGSFLGVFFWSFADNIITLFPLHPTVSNKGIMYLKVIAFPAGAFLVLLIGEAICRGAGYTKIPLLVSAVANVINILGNYVLIFGKWGFPELGILGSAIATSGALIVASIMVWSFIGLGKINIVLNMTGFYDRKNFWRILKLSIPAAGEEGIRASSNYLLIFMLSGLGSVAYAAHQIAITIESFSFMPGWGFAIASSALVGQFLGAGDEEMAQRSMVMSAFLAAIFMGFMGVIFMVFAPYIVRIFTNEHQIIPLAALCVRIAGLEQAAIAISMVLTGGMRGAGDTKFPMYLSLIGNWGIRIPLIYLAIFVWNLGLPAVWSVMVIQWIVLSFIAWGKFRSGTWKGLEV